MPAPSATFLRHRQLAHGRHLDARDDASHEIDLQVHDLRHRRRRLGEQAACALSRDDFLYAAQADAQTLQVGPAMMDRRCPRAVSISSCRVL
jgi:hypothetical protein